MKSDKIAMFIIKLIKMTKNNELTWEEYTPNEKELTNGEHIIDKVYETIIQEKKFQVFKYKYKCWRDEYDFEWSHRIKLNMVDDNGLIDYEFEYDTSLNDLYDIVREQNSEVNSIIENILFPERPQYKKPNDLFKGTWKNDYLFKHGHKDSELFLIKDDNKYFIKDEHIFDIINFQVIGDKVTFYKKAVKPNDNRYMKNELTLINENRIEGFEDGGTKVFYTKQN